MAGTPVNGKFLTAELIAREALYVLETTRVFTGIVNSNYSGEFAEYGDTINVRVPNTFIGKDFTGQVTRQEIKEGKIPVKLDQIADVSFAVTSKDLTLEIPEFSRQLLEPAVRALNNKIDADIAVKLLEIANKNVAFTGKLDDIAKVGRYLDNEKAPQDGRYLVLSPDHKYEYALDDNLSKVAYAGTSDTLRDALLGKVYTLNTLMSNNLPYSLAETVGTAVSYKVEKAGNDVKLTNVDPATGTVKAGDGFIYDGRLYRFTEDKTAAAGTIAAIKYTGSREFTEATAKDVVVIPQALSIALHKDAVTFATRPLDAPVGGVNHYIAQGENFAIRVVLDYDSDTKENLVSLDILYGISGLHDNLAATVK